MTIIQYGSVNLDSLLVPGAYVVPTPPGAAAIVAAPTNILGIVGTGSWGPVNSPTRFGTVQQGQALFGAQVARKYDLMTQVNTAALQGATSFKAVRVTDGTDAAATIEVLSNCLALTSLYTGSGGNSISVSLGAGSAVGSYSAVISKPGANSEKFDNIGAGLTGNAAWVAIAAAINGGSLVRGPSQIVIATAGAGTTSVATATYALTGGTDGASGVTATQLLGNDGTLPRTGMYALRSTQVSIALLADCDTAASWPTQVAFGLSEGIYMIGTGPSGDTITNAISVLQGVGVASTAFKYMQGDWIWWLDPVNGGRWVSPQGFVAGFFANAAPNQAALNKPLQGVAGTQTSQSHNSYAQADLAAMAQAGIDCVVHPSPGGSYFSCFLGHNTSPNALTQSDSYTTMTNFEAASLNGPQGLGQFIGQVNTLQEQTDLVNACEAFLQAQVDQGLIGNSANPAASPFSVTLPPALNNQTQTALGFQFLLIEITYWAIVEKLIATVIGGSSVVIQRAGVTAAA